MIKKLIVICILLGRLFAEGDHYNEAIKHFDAKEYAKAFPTILEEAQKGNQLAQAQMAYMYENGAGTSVDYKSALFWYKKATPGAVERIAQQQEGKKLGFEEAVVANVIGSGLDNKPDAKDIEKLHMSYLEPTEANSKLLENKSNFFGLEPYQTNFLLPVSYLTEKPRRVTAAISVNDPIVSGYTYDKNIETEFQISLQKEIFHDWLGLGETFNAAYTQHVWWQVYAESGPFRESNYMPELFLTIPIRGEFADVSGLKAVKTGFIHQSNGQEGYRSRSWNRLYVTGLWQFDDLYLSTQVWYRIPEDDKSDAYYAGQLGASDANMKGDDNPDIYKYMGYGSIEARYIDGRDLFGVLIRNNLRFNGENKGAIELNYSTPIFDAKDTYWYVKFFNGYGYSMIDYDQSITNFAVGISFSKSLF